MRDTADIDPHRNGDVVLGDDWVAPDSTAAGELTAKRARRGYLSLKTSPLTRKIIMFNLIAISILVAGLLYLNESRESLVLQRATALVSETELIADVFEAQLSNGSAANFVAGGGLNVEETLTKLSLRNGVEVFVFDAEKNLMGQIEGTNQSAAVTNLAPRPQWSDANI